MYMHLPTMMYNNKYKEAEWSRLWRGKSIEKLRTQTIWIRLWHHITHVDFDAKEINEAVKVAYM